MQTEAWKRWYENGGRERIVANAKKWRAANPEKARRIKRNNARRRRALESGSKRGYWITQRDRRRMWSSGLCFWCRKFVPPTERSEDHVIPVSRGGIHSIGNIVPACRTCNSEKRDLLPVEWRNRRNGT